MKLNALIDLYKNKRKEAILKSLSPDCKQQYAFIGVGQHSLSTLYPILSYLNMPLRSILTSKTELGRQLAAKFPGARVTADYEDILKDPAITGLFICSHPSRHYELIRQAFQYNKHVFVEKPPCYSTQELNQLIAVQKSFCSVGLQKRYGTINRILKKKFSKPLYYNARYAVGSYPEGNPVYELFIHVIDNLIFLFGNATVTHLKKIKNKEGLLYLLYLEHASGPQGHIELSTNHNWGDPIDNLRLKMTDQEVLVQYPNSIEAILKERTFVGLPLNKIIKSPVTKKIIYQNKNIINTIESNILYEAGFFNELNDFITLVESPNTEYTLASSLENLKDTYKILDNINEA